MAGSAVYVIAYWRMKDRETGQWLLCTDGVAVGHGARPFADGLDAIYQRHNENYPGEFMEMEFPLRMERYAIAPDSGGPDKYRGGCGVIRDVHILADEGTFGLRVENNIFPTWGMAGGMGGGTSRIVMNPDTEHEKEIRAFSDDNLWSYGVVIDPVTMLVDDKGTQSMRQDLRSSIGPTKLFHRFEYFDTAEEEFEWVQENIPR